MAKILLLILLTFIVFGNTLSNQLFYDDEELIYKNEHVKNLSEFPKYFTTNMVEGAGKTSNMYRPLLITSFAVDHALWGDNAFGYHLTNVVLHAVNTVLVYLFVQILFRNSIVSLITAILFSIHPVQSEAIAYTSGRTDPLSSVFVLSSLLSFLQFLKKNTTIFLVLSLALFLFALLSKELSIVLPVILPFCIWIYTTGDKKKRNLYIHTIPYIGIALIYIVLRLTVFNFANSLNFYTAQTAYSTQILIRIWTFFHVVLQYFMLLIFPKSLVYAHTVSIITSPFHLSVGLFILIGILLIFLSWKYKKIHPWILFTVVWFFLFLLPSSGIIPINSIMQEHYLYLPSVGFFLFVSYLVSSIRNRYILATLATIVCLAFSVRTVLRNAEWKDALTFYAKDSSSSNNAIMMMNNLAMEYANRGDLEKAISEYKRLIQTADIYPNTHHNLANALKTQKKYDEAEIEYRKALVLDPSFHFSYAGLLDLYTISGQQEKLGELQNELRQKGLL